MLAGSSGVRDCSRSTRLVGSSRAENGMASVKHQSTLMSDWKQEVAIAVHEATPSLSTFELSCCSAMHKQEAPYYTPSHTSEPWLIAHADVPISSCSHVALSSLTHTSSQWECTVPSSSYRRQCGNSQTSGQGMSHKKHPDTRTYVERMELEWERKPKKRRIFF